MTGLTHPRSPSGLDLAGRRFSPSHALIVAEIAQTHEGSLGLAHCFIDAAADAGADAVKFQTHIADAESTPAEPWRVKFSTEDATRYDYWKRMEFFAEQWLELKEHADRRGIIFLSSPFSPEAVSLLLGIGVPAWKVASGEIFDPLLLDAVFETGLPLIVSTGLCTEQELDAVVVRARHAGTNFAVLQCTSAYPCPPERVGLNLLNYYRERFECPVGLSDHSGTIFPGLAAAALGASVIEVHLTLSPRLFGPDVPSSLTPEQLALLVDGVRFIESANSSPVAPNMTEEKLRMRSLFGKSPVTTRSLAKGHILNPGDICLKKPATGEPASSIEWFMGKTLCRSVSRNHCLRKSDVL